MLHTLERALPPAAQRPGLLQPDEILALLAPYEYWRITAEEVCDYLSRPMDQVLHALSYLTSLGLLSTTRLHGTWYYTRV